jgi:hypothetical protein
LTTLGVTVADELFSSLPRLEWLFETGSESVRRCLEDRASLVGEECLSGALEYYIYPDEGVA